MKWLYPTFLVTSWYGMNISVALLNKLLLCYHGFRYPLLLTLLHMLTCSAVSSFLAATGALRTARLQSRRQLAKIAVLAAVFTASIALGNASLRSVPVSFNQAVGATTPAFTAVLALLIQRQREGAWTYAALVPVVGGIIVVAGFEPNFRALGFALCILSTAGRALKTVVQAVLLTEPSEKMDSLSLLTYMAPVASALLVPVVLTVESSGLATLRDLIHGPTSFAHLLALNCAAAFLTNLLNFLVTRHTSALSIQVLGNFKGAVAAAVSVLLFQNDVSVVSCMGYAVTLAGVILYGHMKRTSAARPCGDAEGGVSESSLKAQPPLTVLKCSESEGSLEKALLTNRL